VNEQLGEFVDVVCFCLMLRREFLAEVECEFVRLGFGWELSQFSGIEDCSATVAQRNTFDAPK
jgi:hypothetical protein